MFDYSGEKLQKLAKVFFALGAIASVIWGIVLFAEQPELSWLGFVIIVVGIFSSWVSSLVLHALGEAAENSENCAYLLRSLERTINNTSNSNESVPSHTNNSNESAPSYKPSRKWRCKCGALVSDTTDCCPQCGNYK